MLRIPFVLFFNLIRVVRWLFANFFAAIGRLFRRGSTYVEVELSGSYPFGRAGGLARYLETDATFLELKRDIKALAEAADVTGIVLKPGKARLGRARSTQLVDLLDSLREAGKHVVATGELLQTSDYVEATTADHIVMPPGGRLYTFGPRIEPWFVAEALRRHGVTAQVHHIGAFKTVMNEVVRDHLTVPARLMMSELRDGLESKMLSRVAARRSLTPAAASTLFRIAPCDSRTAIAGGLVDAEAYEADLPFWLKSRDEHRHVPVEPETSQIAVVKFSDWLQARPKPLVWEPLLRHPRVIAVVELEGMIISPGMSIPGGTSVIDPTTVVPLLHQLAGNRRVAGVLLHINSPGGSAMASDTIWKAVSDLRSQKPVVAYCSDTAASGGYYIAAAADRIVCHPETITGSIGIVMTKLALGDALARHGVTHDTIEGDGPSDFMSIWEPMSPGTRENVVADGRNFYRRFLQRVGQGRGLSKRRLHRYARGRVYLGDQALERGLVDATTGFEGALAEVVALVREAGTKLADEPPLAYFAHRSVSLKDALRRSAIASPALTELGRNLDVAAMVKQEPLLAMMMWRIQ